MDILAPELVWVDNRCYRKIPVRKSDKHVNHDIEDTYQLKPNKFENDDEALYSDLPIEYKGNEFWITFPIPGVLVKHVVGKYHKIKNQIEEETSTKLNIPASNVEGNIVITGSHKNGVGRAYRRIESRVKDARWIETEPTHFISIPMNNKYIKDGFLKFKEDVLINFSNCYGIDESVFEKPARLHLTIAMLTLFDAREKEAVKAVLLKSKTDILNLIRGKSLEVELKGIEYMNDDPAEVDVLYGKVREVDGDNCLQLIADKLANVFAEMHLSQKSTDSVKLHTTIMKSRTKDNLSRQHFDARKILEKYVDYSFGRITISEIHVSVRFSGSSTSYYKSTFVMKL